MRVSVFATTCCAFILSLAACAANPGVRRLEGAPTSTASGGQCISIQRGVNGRVADTRIAQRWPNRNYGAQPAASTATVSGGERDVLLAFDLSAIPPDASITRAVFTVHKSTGGAAHITAHRITLPWDEHTATWDSFGSAFESEPIASASSNSTEPEPLTFDVTPLVRAWQSGAANYGLALRDESSMTGPQGEREHMGTGFATSEAGDLNERPRLEVCFW